MEYLGTNHLAEIPTLTSCEGESIHGAGSVGLGWHRRSDVTNYPAFDEKISDADKIIDTGGTSLQPPTPFLRQTPPLNLYVRSTWLEDSPRICQIPAFINLACVRKEICFLRTILPIAGSIFNRLSRSKMRRGSDVHGIHFLMPPNLAISWSHGQHAAEG